ncbi:MAG: dihydroorotase [Oscillospiraceae bacterium]|nr:dihydroorotase [Oscillospiraceae bacterium]
MLIIKSGRVISPANHIDEVCDVLVENGVITGIGAIDAPKADLIDARGLIVAPGLIDVHAHFREPGQTHKEDIATGAEAAKKGGFTSVLLMANTNPPADNKKTLSDVLLKGKKTGINIYSAAALSRGLGGDEHTGMAMLKDLGAAAFSDDGMPVLSTRFLREAMLEAKKIGAIISLHEEDPALVECAGIDFSAPWIAESSMIARDVMLALETGVKLHIQHVSSEKSVKLIQLAKAFGADVTAEVTPQHFSLTHEALKTKGALAKVNPPLRSERDRLSLIEALGYGTIDMIATDHAPHASEEKSLPIELAPSGMTGLETALALGVTNLVRTGYLTLPALIAKMTANPAKRFGFKAGEIAKGKPADIVIFDEAERWTVKAFASKSQNSPFIGDELYGKVKYTICGGNIVYSD